MPRSKVNKTTAFEFEGSMFANMADAEIAVRKSVIHNILHNSLVDKDDLEEVAALIAQKWIQIKNEVDAAFAGI